MFKKFFNKDSIFSTVFTPTIAMFILAVLKVNPVEILSVFLGNWGEIFKSFIIENSLLFTINSTILILLINIFFLNPYIDLSVRNNAFIKKDLTTLYSASNPNTHMPSKIILSLLVNYRHLLWFGVINILGGIQIKITYPTWVDLTVNNTPWNTSYLVDNTHIGHALIDVNLALPKTKLDNYCGELFISLNLLSNLNSYDAEFLDISIVPKSNNIISKSIMHILILIFFGISYTPHKLDMQAN